ncbi:MAG TPA: TIGR03118 family protein [Candidatus Acidoferrum sp.]|nr:TIGR03118 family protein [Candidatus Acidoferrum sp.]
MEKHANSNRGNKRRVWPALVLTAMLAASGAAAKTFYARTNLVSDIPGFAAFTSSNLIGAWGITRSATSPWWVNSTVGGVSQLFNGAGEPFPTNSPLVVAIPPVPSQASGIVFNGGGGFDVASNASALFIFVTLNGSISGWSPAQANPKLATLKVNNPGAAYTGVTIAPLNGTNALYVANYGEDRIEVYGQNFSPVMLSSNAFTDDDVPANLNVFNVQLISSNLLFVTYAPLDVFGNSTVPGAGFVSVFSTDGILLGHLRHGPWMNAPWGVTPAPGHNHTLLVGMFGSGQIAQFDADYGSFRGLLKGPDGRPIEIGKGLWGLGFGNGATAGPTNQLFFAADDVTTNGFHGVFGAFVPVHHSDEDDDNDDDQGDNNGGDQ